jgi:cystathionine beta-lyase
MIMKYDFDTVVDRRNTNCMKWDAGEFLQSIGITGRFDEDTISAFTADMDFRCAQPIVDAVTEVARFGVYGYPHLKADSEYYDIVAKWFEQYEWKIEKEEIVAIQGTLDGIQKAIQLFTDPGEGVIIFTPVYGVFRNIIEGGRRIPVNCRLLYEESGRTVIDYEAFEALAQKDENTAVLFCNPQNPSGNIWCREELDRVVEICKKYNLLLISDEVHCDLTRVGIRYTPMAVCAKDHAKFLAFTAPNKTFNIAGLQVCNVVVPDAEVRKDFAALYAFHSPSQFGIAACMAAYEKSTDWLNQLRQYIDESMDWAINFMREYMPKVKCWRPEATYCLWLNFEAYGYDEQELCRRIMTDANVALEAGAAFDPEGGQQYMRICMPSAKSVIQEAFKRIAEAIQT